MATVFDDLRDGTRILRRSPGLVAAAVFSLGLGIGATTAVFSFVNAVQFSGLGVEDEATLVSVSETSATELCAGCGVGTSFPAFLDWRARARSFASLEGYREEHVVVSRAAAGREGDGRSAGSAPPERVTAAIASPGLFPTLGVRPAIGRGLLAEDDRPDSPPVVVIGDAIWSRRFARDPAVLGRSLRIDGRDRLVVGVMPARFAFPEYAELWLPLTPAAGGWTRTDRSLGVVGRLRPGVALETARVEMETIGAALAFAYPDHRRWTTETVSLRASMTGETAIASIVMLAAVAFVLLIACANVANLLLVRACDRRRELAIRTALGAGAGRIARLVLLESVSLAIVGGLAGLLLAIWASGAMAAAMGADAPYWIRFGIDARVLGFGLALTAATGVACGLVPAVQASRPDVRRVLNEGGAAVGGGAAQRMRSVLAAGQLALSVALLAGAGLMIKTVVRTFTFDAGYDVTRVLVGDVALAGPRYDDPAQILAFGESVIARLGRLPGVRAAIGRTVFLRGFGAEPRRIVAEGVASVSADASPSFYDAVTPGYFAALGLTVREGRDFEPAERTGVIVNRELARRVWGTRPALGQRFQFGDEATRAQWFTVVGLVDVPGGSPIAVNPNRPVAYVPIAAAPGRELAVTVGTDGNPAALVSEVRAAVAAADPDQPIEDLKTMEAAFAQWVTPARAVGALMASLAAVALLMAAMGTFGVVAFSVSRRSREIGVRLALGATPRQVQALMAGAGVRLAAAGLAFGLPAAWLSTRTLEGILAGTSPTDPMAFTAAVLLLVLATLIAAWLPARRAARIDPLTVLRQE